MRVLLCQIDGKIPNLALMRIAGVYAIEHIATGRLYVGSSKNVFRRLRNHELDLDARRHHNAKLQNAWMSYGSAGFAASLLHYPVDLPNLFSVEQSYMDTLRPFFNIAKRADVGGVSSPESREAARLKMLGHSVSAETRQKISERLRGSKASPEALKKMSVGQRRAWADPESRAARILSLRESWKANPTRHEEARARSLALCRDSDHSNKVSAGHRKSWALNPGRKQKTSAFAVSQWNSQGHREAVRETQRRRWSQSERLLIVEMDGTRHSLREWSALANISVVAIRLRLRRGWTVERALNTPMRNCRPEHLLPAPATFPLWEGAA